MGVGSQQTRGKRVSEATACVLPASDMLPHVEDGTIVLIGATTENPYYEINSPLLSRLRVYRLEPLGPDEIREIVSRAVVDARGLAGGVALPEEAMTGLLELSSGDARQALNIMEAAAAAAGSGGTLTPEAVAEAAQQRLLAYDRVGDEHYEAASALIKSMRGNDPDAALYWCASMVAAGEDPTFIARRIVIAASEDVGNADPRALQIAVAAMQAVEMIGLPEAQYALAQAAAYVASAPKSNRAGAAYPPSPVHPSAAGAGAGLRQGLPLPARLRVGRRRAAVPARCPRRSRLLRAERGGDGEADRGSASAAQTAASGIAGRRPLARPDPQRAEGDHRDAEQDGHRDHQHGDVAQVHAHVVVLRRGALGESRGTRHREARIGAAGANDRGSGSLGRHAATLGGGLDRLGDDAGDRGCRCRGALQRSALRLSLTVAAIRRLAASSGHRSSVL